MDGVIKTAFVRSRKVAYRVCGDGPVQTLVATALGSLQAEWWPMCEMLGMTGAVLVYDRSGYGQSDKQDTARTPRNIALEMEELLSSCRHDSKITIIGHSIGGLYAMQYAQMFPEKAKGLLLLDPLSIDDKQFKRVLTAKEYSQSGVDKSRNLRLGLILATIGLAKFLKPLLKKAPPFYYYSNYSNEAIEYILEAMTKKSYYATTLEEYRFAHDDAHLAELRSAEGFPNIPIGLMTHGTDVMIEEIIQYGGASRETAIKIDSLWQELMKKYLEYSKRSFHVQSNISGHFIHLTDMKGVMTVLNRISEA